MAEIYLQRVVEAAPERVVAVLWEPKEWLEETAAKASLFARSVDVRLRAELGRGAIHAGASKRVHLEVGGARLVRDHFVVPMTWEASGFPGLFPVMDAVIEIYRSKPGQSRLIFWGRYDPPLGRTGELIDRFLAHSVSEATVTFLLEALETKLRSEPEQAESATNREEP